MNGTNRLIKSIMISILALGLVVSSTACSFGGNSLTDIITGSKEPEEYRAKSISDFVDAIQPNVVITFKDGNYDLTTELRKLYGTDGNDFNREHKYAKIECVDGDYKLLIENVSGLTIEVRNQNEVSFEFDSSSADIITFTECENITVSGLLFAQKEYAVKEHGSLFRLVNCKNITLDNLGIFGVKGYAISAKNTDGLMVDRLQVSECRDGFLSLTSCKEAVFTDCEVKGVAGVPIKVTSGQVDFTNCSFVDCKLDKGFITGSADNDIKFGGCCFGIDESKALNYGEVTGDEGYVFSDDCTWVNDDPTSVSGIGNTATLGVGGEYQTICYASNMSELIENIQPDVCVVLAEGEYNIDEYINSIQNIDRWNERYEYVGIDEDEDGSGYALTICCNNFSIIGAGEYGDKNAHIVKDYENASIMSFRACEYILVKNITFGYTGKDSAGSSENTVNNSSELTNALSFSNCGDIQLQALDIKGVSGTGVKTKDCDGSWLIYDCSITDCYFATLEFNSFDGKLLADTNRFINSNLGILIAATADSLLKFSTCELGYAEYIGINSCAEAQMIGGTHLNSVDGYVLIEENNLTFEYMYDSMLTDRWYGYQMARDGEIVDIPYESDDESVFFDVEFYDNTAGKIILDENKQNTVDFLWKIGEYPWLIEITYYDEEAQGMIKSYVFSLNDDGYMRILVEYHGAYYLCW